MWSWLLVALAAPVDDVANPRPAGWVADAADVLPPEAEDRLNAELDALHRDLDAELAVVTVLAPPPEGGGALAETLLGAWGIGDAEAHNGVVVLLVADRGQVDVRSGAGLSQVLSDSWLAELEQTQLAPALATGDLVGGLTQAVTAIDARLRAHPDEARQGAQRADVDNRPLQSTMVQEAAFRQALDTLQLTAVLGGCIALGLTATAAGVVYVRRQERTCPTCKIPMPMLSEEDDDLHLTPGQVKEEQIGSVDYQVHQCPKCGQTRTFVVHQFWTSYHPCPHCNNRTREIERTTVTPATLTAQGLDQVEERCHHCDYRASYTRATPVLPAQRLEEKARAE